jgi:hypothetical protein
MIFSRQKSGRVLIGAGLRRRSACQAPDTEKFCRCDTGADPQGVLVIDGGIAHKTVLYVRKSRTFSQDICSLDPLFILDNGS